MRTNLSKLDDRRRARGLTIADLARLASVPYPRLWRAVTGGGRLADDEVARLAAVLADDEETSNATGG